MKHYFVLLIWAMLHEALKYYDSHGNAVAWTLVASFNYVILMKETWTTIRKYMTFWRGAYFALILGALLFERLKYHDSRGNPVVWTLVIINSLVTTVNYMILIKETWTTIWKYMTLWRGVISLCIFVGGLMSSYTLFLILWQAHTIVMKTDLDVDNSLLFYLAAFARSVHCVLGGKQTTGMLALTVCDY